MAEVPEVALSMMTLVPGGMGGSETYARELTRQLATTDRARVRAFVPETAAGFSVGIPEIVIRGVRGGTSTPRRVAALAATFAHTQQIRTAIGRVDVVHYPLTVIAPRPRAGQAIVQTLLDVQHLDLPHLFGAAELAYRRRFYEGAARTADLVITISEFARQRMVELLGISPDRIRVAHLGVDAEKYSSFLGEREEFVLYPARGWKHKNHVRLVAAMERVRRVRPGMRLVLTGGGLDALGALPDWVDRRGLVDAAELNDLYRRAAALAFPSLYEGFGLPPLEAMASGCPVAATNAGSVPEVCGDAAVLFDALDPESIADGILSAIDRSDELARRGAAQVARFTWERCRDTHLDAYRDVA